MPFEFPYIPNRPERLEHQFKDVIQEGKESEIVQTVNHGFGTTGAQLGAWTWGSDSWGTTSTTYTVTNQDVGVDLDQINPVISPSRTLFLGTDGDCIVEFEAVGQDLDLEISIYDDTETLVDTLEVTCGSSPEDQRTYYRLSPGSYRLAFRGKTNASTGYLYQLCARELPLENLCFDYAGSCSVNGGFWIGQYANGADVSRWDNEDYVAGEFIADGSEPAMNRDTYATGVHSGTFDRTNAEYMITNGADDVSSASGFLMGGVIDSTGTSYTFQTVIAKSGNGSFLATAYLILEYNGSNWRGRGSLVCSGTEYLVNPVITNSGAMDLLMWWDGSTLYLLQDGVIVGSTSTSGTIDDADGEYVFGALDPGGSYWANGDLTMPVAVTGDFTRREVDRYLQFRRAFHGIW